MNLYKPLAFIRRDLLQETSYHFSLGMGIFGILFSLTMFFFIAKLFGKAALPYLRAYEVDYFPFVLIGMAFYNYLNVSLHTFSEAISGEQMMGTLEAMLLTPTKPYAIAIYLSLWSFIYSTIEVLIYLGIGGLVFGVDLSRANLLSGLVVLIPSIISFSCIGLISASFILAFKRGDPITSLLGSASALLGGVYYPVTILPPVVQNLSYLLPITYSLRALRHALLQGYSPDQILPDLAMLGLFCAVLLPLSLACFNYALRRARMDGSLSQY